VRDRGEAPEFNAVDAALWFVVAVHDFLDAAPDAAAHDRQALDSAVDAIVSGYARGTRYGIRADDDGLLAAGQPGLQLTWMDARVGDRVVTPRIGKPVEVQALWLNALHIAGRRSERWRSLEARGRAAFAARCPTASTSIIVPGPSTRRSGPTRSSRWAACPSRFSTASEPGEWSTPSRRGWRRRSGSARSPRASRATRRTTGAASVSATPRTIRAPSGPG